MVFFKPLCIQQSLNAAAMPAPGVCMNIISTRHRKDGYGTVTNPEKFLNQDYHQLKQNCLTRRLRFIDERFPPDRHSIGEEALNSSELAQVVWLRPAVSVALTENYKYD